MKYSWLAALAFLVTVRCGGTDGSQGGGSGGKAPVCTNDDESGSYPCDVGLIIEAKCTRCHTTEEARQECFDAGSCLPAPFSLLTFADSRKEYGGTPVYIHIARVVESGAMPMKSDTISPPVESLTDDEKRILIDWAEGCAPPAESPCD